MPGKTETSKHDMRNNNNIYRLVGELVRLQGEITTGLSEVDLKDALKAGLAKSRFRKDIMALGGLESALLNELLNGFVDSLVKQEAAPSSFPYTPFSRTDEAMGIPASESPRTIYRYETVEVHCHRCHRSCCSCSHSSDSFWFWMYLFNSGGTTHHHHSDSKNSETSGDVLFAIVAFIAVVLVILSAVIAAIYLFGEVADIIERLAHHEGSSYAMLSLSLLGISAAGSFLGATAVMPLIFLAAGASNPVGWSIFSIICLGTVFTAISHALLFQLPSLASEQNFQETFGSDSFVGKDFGRVQLTDAEAKHLEDEEGLDPMKVRIAIALLRQEMGAGAVPSKYGNHALFSQSCRTTEQQKCLDTIRLLRAGKLEDQDFASGVITVGKMKVDMRLEMGPNLGANRREDNFSEHTSADSSVGAY